MGWFKTIYESIINEISAEDAYRKYYSSIPREDYDAILDGEVQPNNFMKFILNSVRDKKSDVDEAIRAVQEYKNTDNLVRQSVKNKFDAGEYEDVAEIISDIEYFSSGGAILSRKKFAKEGYIKVKETDRWLVTSTTNYLANNHYFGTSRWCTASDREGRYDGYSMFLRYGKHSSSVLFQFKWKGKVEPLDTSKPIDEHTQEIDPVIAKITNPEEWNRDGGFVGEKLPERYSLFQIQVQHTEKHGISTGQICDLLDYGLNDNDFQAFVGTELFSVTQDDETLSWLQTRMNEQFDKERDYQRKMDVVIQKRRERWEQWYREEQTRLTKEVKVLNEKQKEFVRKKWQEFCEKKMYEDPEIVSYIHKRDYYDAVADEEAEKAFSKTNYVGSNSLVRLENSVFAMHLTPVMGKQYFVGDTTNSRGYDCPSIMSYATSSEVEGGGGVVVFYNAKEKQIVNASMGPFNCYYSRLSGIYQLDGSESRRFIEVIPNRSEYELDSTIVYDYKVGKTFTTEEAFTYCIDLKNGTTVFFPSSNSYDWEQNFYFYDEATSECHKQNPQEIKCRPLAYGSRYESEGIVLYSDNDDFQTVYKPGENIYGLKLPLEQVGNYGDDSYDADYDGIVNDVSVEYNFITIRFSDGLRNVVLNGTNEVIFGRNGDSLHVYDDNTCEMRVMTGDEIGKAVRVRYSNGKYERPKGGLWISCDKFGNIEEDKVASKNFADWQAQGGHSPEAKAQMDKMWADRNGENINPLDAWDDNDTLRDMEQSDGIKYTPDFKFSQAMQKFDDDENWRGYIGFKDPEGQTKSMNKAIKDPDYGLTKLVNGEIPDYVRRNPWYRIGKNGKPLDQPWYDEDEIPARLSDRVIKEQKINESINKMRSIWDRMGLND